MESKGGIRKFLEYACAAALVVVSSLVAYQVFARYVLNNPSSWSEELARMFFIYLTFLGAALAVLRSRSLRIHFFVERLSPKMRLVAKRITGTITMVFLIVTIYYSYWLLKRLSGGQTPALELPIAVFYISVPFGCLLMIAAYIKEFRQKK